MGKYKISQLIEDFKEVRNVHGDLPVMVYTENAKDQFSFVSVVADFGGKVGKVLMLMTAKEADKYMKNINPKFKP